MKTKKLLRASDGNCPSFFLNRSDHRPAPAVSPRSAVKKMPAGNRCAAGTFGHTNAGHSLPFKKDAMKLSLKIQGNKDP